jgi:RHS repeat-associated protein
MLIAAKEGSNPFLAASFLSRNSPPAHQLPTPLLYPGIGFAISNTATGLATSLYDEGRRSRSTGKERDTETGLDYFGARYFGSALGRFASPDPGNSGAEPSDLQSWNAYPYTGNNPLSRTDPDGLDYHVCVNDQNGNQQCTNIENDKAFQQVAKNPGAGLTVSGDKGSGVIYSTDQNGNRVQVGTYEHFAGPGTEGGGITVDFGTELAVAGLGARVLNAGASIGEGAQPIVERSTGAQVGWKSADGMKIARNTSANNAQPYINLVNKAIGGNLHVRF